MAIFHFSAKVIGRSSGRSAVAAAAYRAGERLHDERIDRDHDFTNKAGVLHSEVMLPKDAPEGFADRTTLWNAVEAAEKRKDAQLAREVEFALPRELAKKDNIKLARAFVAAEFVEKGMIADLNVHWDIGQDGKAKPHAQKLAGGLAAMAGMPNLVPFSLFNPPRRQSLARNLFKALALMPEDERPSYDTARFDESLGATVVENLRFADADDGEAVVVSRAEFYGVDMDAIERIRGADADPGAVLAGGAVMVP